MTRHLFTSESVTEGHPDKICDQISDAILDAHLTQDPKSRVAAEVVVNTGLVLITGEISSKSKVDYVKLVRQKIAEIGYTEATNGFSTDSCAVLVALDEQSSDIAQGVNLAQECREQGSEDDWDATGAGDQGIMFGYACKETPELMPLPISLAHRLARQLAVVRKTGKLPYLRPAGLIHAFNLQYLPYERSGRFYQDVAAYGHFGRTDLDLPWERLDKVAQLQEAISVVL